MGRLLPLVIGDLVPADDKKWESYLQMMKIVDILFAPVVTLDILSYLSRIIEGHHLDFTSLYPDESVLPKMHFIVHMPRLMKEYNSVLSLRESEPYESSCTTDMAPLYGIGPWGTRQSMRISRLYHIPWVMISFTTFVPWLYVYSRAGNFINFPYSLAMRHEQHQCYLRIAPPSTTNELLTGKGIFTWVGIYASN